MREDKFQRQNPLEPIAPADEYSQLLARVDKLLMEETDLNSKQEDTEPLAEQILKVLQYSGKKSRTEPSETEAEEPLFNRTADAILAQSRQERKTTFESVSQEFETILESNSDTSIATAEGKSPKIQKRGTRSRWNSWLGKFFFSLSKKKKKHF